MPFQQSKLCMNFQRFYWEYSLSPPQDHLFITTPFFLVQNIIQSTMTIPFRKQVEYDHLNQCSPDQDCCSDVLTACAVTSFQSKGILCPHLIVLKWLSTDKVQLTWTLKTGCRSLSRTVQTIYCIPLLWATTTFWSCFFVFTFIAQYCR